MKKNMILFALLFPFSFLSLSAAQSSSNKVSITHCYHWLKEKKDSAFYLKFKYDHSEKNSGDLTFFTTYSTTNGAAAGEGLYCSKDLFGSIDYGDRVIRVDFVDDVVVSDTDNKKYCGLEGSYYATKEECDSKEIDVKLFNSGRGWYVIKNPKAVKSWTATSDVLVADIQQAIKTGSQSNKNTLEKLVAEISQEVSAFQSRKNEIRNFNARLGIQELVESPQKLREASINSVHFFRTLDASKYKINKVKLAEIKAILVEKALSDQIVSISDFDKLDKELVSSTFGSNFEKSEITTQITEKIKKIRAQDVANLNIPFVIEFAEKYKINIKSDVMEAMARAYVHNLSRDSAQQGLFSKINPGGDFYKRIKLTLGSKNLNFSIEQIGALNSLVSLFNLVEGFDSESNTVVVKVATNLFSLKKYDLVVKFLSSIKSKEFNKVKVLESILNGFLSRNEMDNLNGIEVANTIDTIVKINTLEDVPLLRLVLAIPLSPEMNFGTSAEMIKKRDDNLVKFRKMNVVAQWYDFKTLEKFLAEKDDAENTTESKNMQLSGVVNTIFNSYNYKVNYGEMSNFNFIIYAVEISKWFANNNLPEFSNLFIRKVLTLRNASRLNLATLPTYFNELKLSEEYYFEILATAYKNSFDGTVLLTLLNEKFKTESAMNFNTKLISSILVTLSYKDIDYFLTNEIFKSSQKEQEISVGVIALGGKSIKPNLCGLLNVIEMKKQEVENISPNFNWSKFYYLKNKFADTICSEATR